MWNTFGVRNWSEAMSWLASRDPFDSLSTEERGIAERVENHLLASIGGDKGEVRVTDETFFGLNAEIADTVARRIAAWSDFNCTVGRTEQHNKV